jgi:hypothetical protein
VIEILLLIVILLGLVRIARALAQCCALLRALSFTHDNGGNDGSRRDNVIAFRKDKAA